MATSLLGLLACYAGACGGRVDRPNASGTGGNSSTEGSDAASVGAGNSGGSGTVTDPAFLASERTLDSLTLEEIQAVCREDARRTDICMHEGLASVSLLDVNAEASCEQVVAQCRAEGRTAESTADCETLRDLSDCPVTLAQYFACVDAWNLTQSCENAGITIHTPEPCAPVTRCADFRFEFDQFGRPARCDPAEITEEPSDTNDDIYGLDGCYPVPERLVALGNSIVNCEGDLDGYGCAASMLAHYVRQTYEPGLAYEMYASNGGDLADLARQVEYVEGGPGHVAVWVWSFPTDDPHSLDFDLWESQIAVVLAYFTNASRFPGGVTFLFNTQYSPSDQCPDSPDTLSTPLSLEEEGMLQEINQRLFIDLAVERADTVTIDQYPDWLGHGWNAGVAGCPHCSSDNAIWQYDPIHPNQDGQVHIFEKWRVAVDRMYGCTP